MDTRYFSEESTTIDPLTDDEDRAYIDFYNEGQRVIQSWSDKENEDTYLDSRAFFHSDTAKLLLLRGQRYGIRLSQAALHHVISDTFMSIGHGNPYSRLGRSLCSTVSRSALSQYVSVDKTMDTFSGNRPFDLLLHMGRLTTLATKPVTTEPPFERSCYDAEQNFMYELTRRNRSFHLTEMPEGELFITKYYNDYTSLNLTPVEYHGVKIPPGFICDIDHEHRELYTVYRPSAFVFSERDAISAFGQQLTRMEHKKKRTDRVRISDAFGVFGELRNAVSE